MCATVAERGGEQERTSMANDRGATAKQIANDHGFKILAASAMSVVLGATVVYRLLEDWSWVDSLYFSVVAVTTVGFGDLTPSTDASKLFTVLYILVGISLITAYLNMRLKRRATREYSDD